MNTWVDQMIVNLELKQAELQRQVDGIKAAVEALKKGYDHPILQVPAGIIPTKPMELSPYYDEGLTGGVDGAD